MYSITGPARQWSYTRPNEVLTKMSIGPTCGPSGSDLGSCIQIPWLEPGARGSASASDCDHKHAFQDMDAPDAVNSFVARPREVS
jgi:hypothetical protein